MFKKVIFTAILLFWPFSIVYAQELKDVRPPVSLPPNFFILYLLLIILGLFLIWLLLARLVPHLKRKKKALSVPPKAPWDLAYERLAELKAEDLPSQGRVKEYYIRLSDIVRRYMEGRFSIHAPEMTTEEFLVSLQNLPGLNAGQRQALKEFLVYCDMVKFAKYGSDTHEMEESYASARRLVDETKRDVILAGFVPGPELAR